MVIIDTHAQIRRELATEWRKAEKEGTIKTFSFKGFPEFKYLESSHPYLQDHLGCILSEKDHPEVRGPGKVIFVSAKLPKNFRKIVAVHEYNEATRGSHQAGIEMEKNWHVFWVKQADGNNSE